MEIIDGRKIRDQILENLKDEVRNLKTTPTLAIILVGGNKASAAYVRQKSLAGEKIGAKVIVKNLNSDVSKDELENLINQLNRDTSIHGIIIQLPLPEHLNEEEISDKVLPEKDVDGFVPGSKFRPATAMGVVELLKRSGVEIKGKNAVVVGRGKVAGRPTAELLREEGARVEVVHSKTENPAEITKKADILVSAVGKPNLITADMVKPGAVVVDVGTTPVYPQFEEQNPKSKITGDVDFDEVSNIASKITPVPGGVGPMTVAALMQNLVTAARAQN
ncbi:bifunctional 5,10-methylenetetrahydrofolate dehydrogenase/5,10-methenyltetrahydrofolate cyclohydrolase [Patescibacteria group bacterium]|nr:bifunctional 5,10-methylenetetrahydrofolate dehydrogenase/5,10-methenyltetrahydrofolate cyclohydrolase [Patescibacteria group bacterium]